MASAETLARQVRFLPALDSQTPTYSTGFNTGKVVMDVRLSNRFQLFDPDDPVRYQWYTEFIVELRFQQKLVDYCGLLARY